MAAALSSRTRLTSRLAVRTTRRAPTARRPMTVNAFKVTLITPSGTKEIECDGSSYILDAAEDAGLDLPFSCRSGTCSSCAAKQTAGPAVDQSDQNYLNDEQIDAGYVMTCAAYPTGDCTLETHKEEELY